MSSPAAIVRRACADGSCRLRGLRARRLCAGVLGLALSFAWFFAASPAAGQFPIRQMPQSSPLTPSGAGGPGRAISSGVSRGWNALGGAGSSRREEPTPQQPHPAIARITVPEKNAVSYGSGTLVDARGEFGLVITNWHVVRDAAGTITVDFPEGHRSAAHVVRTDPDWDLAALAIHRPKAEPLPMSAEMPRVGEMLTIAGYGSGDYRAASGPLAGFASPRFGFPEEMLDLSAVEARQGDSGGPIINQRGEVCGVLFGSAPGYTIGSYGGRVRQFLASVTPDGQLGSDRAGAAGSAGMLAANTALGTPPATVPPATVPPATVPPTTVPPIVTPPANAIPPALASAPQATALHQRPAYAAGLTEREQTDPLTPARGAAAASLIEAPVREWNGEADAVDPKAAIDRLAANLPRNELVAGDSEPASGTRLHSSLPPRLGAGATQEGGPSVNEAGSDELLSAVWKRFGGSTLFDQTKAVLAIVGVLAIAAQCWRLGSRREEYSDEE